MRPFLRTSSGTLYRADALACMNALTPGTCRLVVADPPYNIGKASWDGIRSSQEYVSWSLRWISLAKRLLTGDGTMYVCGFPEQLAPVAAAAAPAFESSRWLVWSYRNKAGMNDDWGRSHEALLHLRAGRSMVFNVDAVRIPYNRHTLRYPARTQAASSRYEHGRSRHEARDPWVPHPGGARPRDVIEVPALCNGSPEKTIHPTQKPEELIRRLVLASSDSGRPGARPLRRLRHDLCRLRGHRATMDWHRARLALLPTHCEQTRRSRTAQVRARVREPAAARRTPQPSAGGAMRAAPVDSVLLIGFGGPDRPEEVMPFLRRVVEGRGVPDERLREVAQHYDLVGGRSPYNELTDAQARACSLWLAGRGRALPVQVGMRNWAPLLSDAIGSLESGGCRHAAGVILAAHRSEPSWDRYKHDVSDAIRSTGSTLTVSYIEPWYDAEGFVEACTQRLESAVSRRRGDWPGDLPLIFTGHSIPQSLADRSPYVADLLASCRAVAGRLGAADWELAYQSRSGDPRSPWLGPDILETLESRASSGTKQVAVSAIGFLSDHVEVLYDLDIEARRLATSLGIRMHRAGCVGSHPSFIEMLGRRILDVADGPTE